MLASTCLFCLLLSIAFAQLPSDLAINSFNNAFYVVNNGVGYYVVDSGTRNKPTRQNFWTACEQIEMLEDAYQRSKNPIYGNMISELINGLNTVVSGTEDWASWNQYNDDIMWGVIALVRSYQLTGNTAHLSQAEIQFNKVWARGWDTAKGGLYWNTDKQTKNACVNGPAAIAGFLLAQSTTHTGFDAQARQAFEWLYKSLYNQTSGQVADHQNQNGDLVWWAFTYNQGTFLGAAQLYSQSTGDSKWIGVAQTAATWTRSHLTGQHVTDILNDEDDSFGGDGVGFKGIFARWCNKFAQQTGNQGLKQWLELNANTAWQYRNAIGVTWNQWWHRTPDTAVNSWACTSAAAVLQVA